ncbi:MAG TPA: hypothetical protein VF060_26990 [Trebonia sp.]
MAWSMEGQLFECCNCEVVCPCSSYPFSGELGGPLAAVSDGEVTLSKADPGSDLEAFGMHWQPRAGLWAHFSWRG